MAKITCTLSAKVDKQTGKSEILLRMQNRKMGNRRAHSRIWILPQFMNETKGEIVIKARKLTPDVKGQTQKSPRHYGTKYRWSIDVRNMVSGHN